MKFLVCLAQKLTEMSTLRQADTNELEAQNLNSFTKEGKYKAE
jgi:hypothetical protein